MTGPAVGRAADGIVSAFDTGPPMPTGDTASVGPDALADAVLAMHLLACAPAPLGGISLRGGGPARDLALDVLRSLLPPTAPWLRLPAHVEDERLAGGTDMAASLASGRLVRQEGLLANAAGGVLVVPMAERMRPSLAGRLAQALDQDGSAGRFILVLLDDGMERDDRPPPALLDRLAFQADLSAVSRLAFADAACRPAASAPGGRDMLPVDLDDDALAALAGASTALGIASVRPLWQAAVAARALAALDGRHACRPADLAGAARLVLAPRAVTLPPPVSTEEPAQPPEDGGAGQHDEPASEAERQQPEDRLDDIVLAAVRTAIPQGVLDQIGAQRMMRAGQGSGAGRRTASRLRGRPLGARPGPVGGGVRLALIDTLRAAIPWQPLRRQQPAARDAGPIRFRKDDLRVRRFEERSKTVTLFCVDASGSAAAARLAQAKGAVELILAQAYVKRSEVALIAFRGTRADLILPPTRSLTRAKRQLADLPGGGGTPLAAGVALARQLGEAILARGGTPMAIFLTDGSANIALDGSPGRAQANADALAAARGIAAIAMDAVVIDIAPRSRPEAARLAEAMRARFLPLPFADATALSGAVARAMPSTVRSSP